MTSQLVDAMNDLLTRANSNWPREPWSTAEGRAGILEKRLARATLSREVEFCVSSVTPDGAGVINFAATVFTADLVISGSLLATEERTVSRELLGDVIIVPRASLRSLTLHQVHNFGNNDEQVDGYVSFTAVYDGMAPVNVSPASMSPGAAGQLFDALQADLSKFHA